MKRMEGTCPDLPRIALGVLFIATCCQPFLAALPFDEHAIDTKGIPKAACVSLSMHGQGGDWYIPGSFNVIEAHLDESCVDNIAALSVFQTLPSGWTYHGLVPGPNNPTIPPNGITGTLGFAWISAPTAPFSFSYTVVVPFEQIGTPEITGFSEYRLNAGAQVSETYTLRLYIYESVPPIIQLNGSDNEVVECGESYADPGAIAIDDRDGDISSAIVVGGDAVDTATPGTYIITYNVQNLAGEQAAEVIRFVTVVDSTGPLIVLIGDDPLIIKQNSEFNDPGASASDTCAGALTPVATGEVNTAIAGDYLRTYTAEDPSGNAASRVRVVRVLPDTMPTLTILGDNPLSVECGSSFLDPGATVTDLEDGAITPHVDSPVESAVPGTYSVSYSATDSGGNTVHGERTVVVSDTTKPTVTLIGAMSITLARNSTFEDPGASANDLCDGALNVVASGNVDTTIVGDYTRLYTASDSAGNTASVTRAIGVVDTGVPVVVINGASPIVTECGDGFSDPGAMASDPEDGVLEVSVQGTVDTTRRGMYTLTYTAVDSAGHSASQSRTVTVVDTRKPVLTLNGAILVSLECGAEVEESGAVALDGCDGSLEVITTGDVDSSSPGSYFVSYSATDSANNTTTVSREYRIVDTTSPAIALIGDPVLTIALNSAFEDPGAIAIDACDGNLNAQSSGIFNPAVLGDYSLLYTATDSAGNTSSVTRLVKVVDFGVPVITLNGADAITVECGSSFVDPGAVATDPEDGATPVVVDGAVDASKPGLYVLTYTARDTGGHTTTMNRTVTIVDTAAPAIHITGDNPTSVRRNASFSDPGATVTDTCDAAVMVSASGDVDTAVIGTYVVTYTSFDVSGNGATTTRTVQVIDDERPEIVLSGANPMAIECGEAFIDPGATASDPEDGERSVSTQGSVDNASPGDYILIYTATDTTGHSVSKSRTVAVSDTRPPVITLLGARQLTLVENTTYKELGALAEDACEGVVAIVQSGDIRTDIPGIYLRTYSAIDASGNMALESRTITVVAKNALLAEFELRDLDGDGYLSEVEAGLDRAAFEELAGEDGLLSRSELGGRDLDVIWFCCHSCAGREALLNGYSGLLGDLVLLSMAVITLLAMSALGVRSGRL